MNSVWYWLCPGWDSMHSLLLESEKADINIQQCFELLCMLFTVGMSMVLLWTRTWITHVTSSSFLTFLWPYFLPSTKGIWLLCCCERCWPKWNVQDLMQKTQDLIFHITSVTLGNHWSTKGGFLDIMYLLHRTEIQHRFCFFHSCLDGYLDSDIFQHTKHPNMDLYKAKVVLIVLTKQTLPLICAHEVPCAEDEDYVFCCELVFFIFFPSPLNIFAQFLLTKFYLPKLYLE